MQEMVLAIAVAAAAFMATNVDNFVLLIALFGRYSNRRSEVLLGYLSGMLVILAITYLVGKVVGAGPVNYLGLLGIFPLMLGILDIVRLFRRGEGARDSALSGGGRTAIAAALLTQLSNSADTIVTFSVLFSDSNDLGDHLVLVSFVGMALFLATIAYHALRFPFVSRVIQHYGPYVTPLILITVGLFVISNTALDMMPGT